MNVFAQWMRKLWYACIAPLLGQACLRCHPLGGRACLIHGGQACLTHLAVKPASATWRSSLPCSLCSSHAISHFNTCAEAFLAPLHQPQVGTSSQMIHRDVERSHIWCSTQGTCSDLTDTTEGAHRLWQCRHQLIQRGCALGKINDDFPSLHFRTTPSEKRSTSSDCLDTSHTI